MVGVSSQYNPDSVKLGKQASDEFLQIPLKSYHDGPFGAGRFLKKWHMHWPPSPGLQAGKAGKQLFHQLLAQHGIVWFHTLGAAFPFMPIGRLPKSVMDLDDLNHCKYDQRAVHDKTLRLRLSARVQACKWKRHEFKALDQYDAVTVCSEQDRTYLNRPNVYVIPNGFEAPAEKPARPNPDPNCLGFIGTLGYGPNHEGLVWFRDKVWPLLCKENPNMTLRVVGTPPQPQYRVEADGFETAGYVEDTASEMARWSAMIVPITYGGGTRIKILDAYSKMCPVVSTSIGAHGIAGQHEKHLLIADDPAQFAQSCLRLAARPDEGRQLAENAWQLFNDCYSWDKIGESVRNIVAGLTDKG